MSFVLVAKSSAQSDTLQYPRAEIIQGDTVILYTVKQAEKLTKAYQELEQANLIKEGLEVQLMAAEKAIEVCQIQTQNYAAALEASQDRVEDLRKKIKRIQRRGRIAASLASVGAVAAVVLVLIL